MFPWANNKSKFFLHIKLNYLKKQPLKTFMNRFYLKLYFYNVDLSTVLRIYKEFYWNAEMLIFKSCKKIPSGSTLLSTTLLWVSEKWKVIRAISVFQRENDSFPTKLESSLKLISCLNIHRSYVMIIYKHTLYQRYLN